MGGKWSCTQTKKCIPILQIQKNLMGKIDYVKKICEYEYKEIDYQ